MLSLENFFAYKRNMKNGTATARLDCLAAAAECGAYLAQGNTFSRGGFKHSEQDGRNLAALDGARGMERALRVGTRQDAGTVELVNFRSELVGRFHVGDRVVRHGVDGLVGLFRAVEDVDELAARDRRVHLCLGVIRVVLFDDAVHNCVIDIAVIPVRAAVFQTDLTGAVELMERSSQLDGLRNGQRRVRLELVRRRCQRLHSRCSKLLWPLLLLG